MTTEEMFIIQLRDCFTAGYTMPQFCIDNDIKKPLILAPDINYWQFLWELHVHFKYDLRINPQFALISSKVDSINLSTCGVINLQPLNLKNISEITHDSYDKILFLHTGRFNPPIDNIIYLDELANYFFARTYAEMPLLHFIQNNPGVKLILTNFPAPTDYQGGVEFNNQLDDIHDLRKKLAESKDNNVKTAFDKFGYTNQEVAEIVGAWESTTNIDGSAYLNDDDNPLVNIKNGRRVVAYQPEKYENTIYFFGASHHLGSGAPYDKNIESYLQKMLNESNLPYRVENESQFVWGDFQHIFYNLNRIHPKKGDIIFAWIDNLRAINIPFFDISRAFDPPYNFREIFAFQSHVNEIGYKIVAEQFFNLLIQNDFFKNTEFKYPPPPSRFTGTVYQRKISYPPKVFYKMRIWKNTRKNCAKKDLRLARLL